jgi:hypothetical protein
MRVTATQQLPGAITARRLLMKVSNWRNRGWNSNSARKEGFVGNVFFALLAWVLWLRADRADDGRRSRVVVRMLVFRNVFVLAGMFVYTDGCANGRADVSLRRCLCSLFVFSVCVLCLCSLSTRMCACKTFVRFESSLSEREVAATEACNGL